MTQKTKFFWEITGYDSTREIFKQTVPSGCFTDRQIQDLLQILVAKAGLSYKEIIGACAKRKTRLANDLLEVKHHRPNQFYECGSNHYFIARIVKQ